MYSFHKVHDDDLQNESWSTGLEVPRIIQCKSCLHDAEICGNGNGEFLKNWKTRMKVDFTYKCANCDKFETVKYVFESRLHPLDQNTLQFKILESNIPEPRMFDEHGEISKISCN